MKTKMRNFFSPILDMFESGEGEYIYKPSQRKILLAVGVLFIFLACISFYFVIGAAQFGGLIPGLVFLTVGVVCEIVGLLGSDRAVARIWKNR